MSRLAAFRFTGGRWSPGTLHEALTGEGGAHREVGGGRYGTPGPGEIVEVWSGLPVYRTGVDGVGAGQWGLGSSCVPEDLRRAAGVPIREYVPWIDPLPDPPRSALPEDADLAAIFGVELEPDRKRESV